MKTYAFPLKKSYEKYHHAKEPFEKLHRLIDLFEMIIRFFTIVSLCSLKEKQLHSDLKDALAMNLERSSLGTWCYLLKDILTYHKNEKFSEIQDLYKYLQDNGHVEKSKKGQKNFVTLRNKVAHQITMEDTQIAQYIQEFAPCIEKIYEKVKFLERYNIVKKQDEQNVYLIDGQSYELCLSPFIKGEETGEKESLFMYSRCTKDSIEYESFDIEKTCYDKKMFSLFQKIFPLQEWKNDLRSRKHYEFIWERQNLTRFFVKRGDETAKFKTWLKTDHNIFVVSGKAGMGKSAFMAHLAKNLEKKHKEKLYTFLYLFRKNDNRCNYHHFLEILLCFFENTFGIQRNTNDHETELLSVMAKINNNLLQNKQIIIFLDGLDEAHARGIKNLCDLPFYNIFTKIRWVLSGREEAVKKISNKDNLNLQGLSNEQVFQFLQGSKLKYPLLNLKEQERVKKVKEITERSNGSPLYLSYLLEDISIGKLDINNIEEIPSGLNNYYAENLKLLGVGGGHEMNILFLVLAYSLEPVSLETIANITFEHFCPRKTDKNTWQKKIKNAVEKATTFLVVRDTKYSLDHEASSDHILSSDELSDDRKSMKDAILEFCMDWKKNNDFDKEYALKYLVKYTLRFMEKEGLEKALEILQDAEYLEEKCCLLTAQSIREDLADCLEFASSLKNTEIQKHQRFFMLLNRAIVLDQKFLDQHPNLLFQCLWNRCWWYDTPQLKENLLKEKSQPPLHEFMENWRKQKEESNSEYIWLESLRPPETSLDMPIEIEFSYSPVPNVASKYSFSPDKQKLIVLMQNELKIINLEDCYESTFGFGEIEYENMRVYTEAIDLAFIDNFVTVLVIAVFKQDEQTYASLCLMKWNILSSEPDPQPISLCLEPNFSYRFTNMLIRDQKIVLGCTDGKIRIWNFEGNLVQTLEVQTSEKDTLHFSHENRQEEILKDYPVQLISIINSNEIVCWVHELDKASIWDLNNGQKIKEYKCGGKVIAVLNERCILVAEIAELKLIHLGTTKEERLNSVFFRCKQYYIVVEGNPIVEVSSDCRKVAIFFVEKKMTCIDKKITLSPTTEILHYMQKELTEISDEQAQQDLQRPIRKRLLIIDIENKECIEMEEPTENIVHISLYDKKLVTTNKSNTVEVWDIDTKQREYQIKHEGAQRALLSSQNKLITESFTNGTIKIWNLHKANKSTFVNKNCAVQQYTLNYTPARFATIEKTKLAGITQNLLKTWDMCAGKHLQDKLIKGYNSDCFMVSPKGSFVAIVENCQIMLFDYQDLEKHVVFPHNESVRSIAISPNENYLAVLTLYSIHVWDINKNTHILKLELPEYFVSITHKTIGLGCTITATSDNKIKQPSHYVLCWNIKEDKLAAIGELGHYFIWEIPSGNSKSGKAPNNAGSFVWAQFLEDNVIAGNNKGEIYSFPCDENKKQDIPQFSELEMKLGNEEFFKRAGFSSSHIRLYDVLFAFYQNLNNILILRKGNGDDLLLNVKQTFEVNKDNVSLSVFFPTALMKQQNLVLYESADRAIAYFPYPFRMAKFFPEENIIVGIGDNYLGMMKLHKMGSQKLQ